MFKPFLVTNRLSEKTLGSVYAASIQSAMDIAYALWSNDRDALFLFDLRQEFEVAQSGKAALN